MRQEHYGEEWLVDKAMLNEVVKLRTNLQQLTTDIPDEYVMRFWQAIEMATGHEGNLKDNGTRQTALTMIALYLYNAGETARLRKESSGSVDL